LDELNKNYPIRSQEKSSFWNDIDFVGYVNGNDKSDTLSKYLIKLEKTADIKADLALYLGKYYLNKILIFYFSYFFVNCYI
jgi:hypothetical protein